MYFNSQKSMAKAYSAIIFFVLFAFSPLLVYAATLSIVPATGNFNTGASIPVRVAVSSPGVSFNAISGVVSFPASLFSIESVSKSNSVLSFWVSEPVISKSVGTVKFEGVVLGGSAVFSGTVITVNLRSIKAGSGQVSFKSGQILANDGQGTDITGNLIGANFSVKDAAPAVTTPKPVPVPQPISIPLPEILQPAPTLKAPEIIFGTKYGAPAVLGTSDYPSAQALITFVAENGVKVFILGVADTDGSFNILIPNSLKYGSYTASAVMIKEDKTNSEASNTIIVKIGSIISDISWEIWLIIALLLISILYLLLRVYSHFWKRSGELTDKNKLHEAEEVIHKSFDILRDDVTEYGNEKSNTAERKHMSEIKKDISDAEKIINKKIKDIESQ